MKIIHEALLDEFRRKPRCEYCDAPTPNGCDPHHTKIDGGEIPNNAINDPRGRSILELIAERERRRPSDLLTELHKIKRSVACETCRHDEPHAPTGPICGKCHGKRFYDPREPMAELDEGTQETLEDLNMSAGKTERAGSVPAVQSDSAEAETKKPDQLAIMRRIKKALDSLPEGERRGVVAWVGETYAAKGA